MKYDHRLVSRTTLADIENQVRFLEGNHWELTPDVHSPSLVEALNACRGKKANLAVAMRKAQR